MIIRKLSNCGMVCYFMKMSLLLLSQVPTIFFRTETTFAKVKWDYLRKKKCFVVFLH